QPEAPPRGVLPLDFGELPSVPASSPPRPGQRSERGRIAEPLGEDQGGGRQVAPQRRNASKKLLFGLGGCGLLAVLFPGCCSGLLWVGYQGNVSDATRAYEEGNQHWEAGNKAEAVEKYRAIKTDWLGEDARQVVAQRIQEYDLEHAREELAAGHRAWAAGNKQEAVSRYKALRMDLIEPTERETVNHGIGEFELAQPK